MPYCSTFLQPPYTTYIHIIFIPYRSYNRPRDQGGPGQGQGGRAPVPGATGDEGLPGQRAGHQGDDRRGGLAQHR